MKRKIEIGIGGAAGALDRFEQAWRRGVARRKGAPEVRLTFESLPVLLKNLTPARWTLIEQLKPGGRLVAPEGASPLSQELVVIDKTARGQIKRRNITPVMFVPMVRGRG